MALSLNYMGDGSDIINEQLYRYAKVSVSQVRFSYVVIDGQISFQEEYVPFKLGSCTDDRFMGEVEAMKGLKIQEFY